MDTTHPKSSPRDVFLYLLAIISLYLSTWRFIDLLFDYINELLPDRVEYWYGADLDAIRWSMATLIIVFPVYLGVTWFLRKDIIKNPEKRELRVRKWLLNLTLFIAAITIISDLVTLVYRFLEGELTGRFLLKVLVVFLTAGAIFLYYFWDLHRETTAHSKPSKILVSVTALVVLGSVIVGFFIVGSPWTQRLHRFDEQRVGHLQQLQNNVTDYWVRKNELPKTLDVLKSDFTGYMPPADPLTGVAYEYRVKAPLTFELCATFSLASRNSKSQSNNYPYALPYYGAYGEPINWEHEEGQKCFSRTIEPELVRPSKM